MCAGTNFGLQGVSIGFYSVLVVSFRRSGECEKKRKEREKRKREN
jgi:hypothetical protein